MRGREENGATREENGERQRRTARENEKEKNKNGFNPFSEKHEFLRRIQKRVHFLFWYYASPNTVSYLVSIFHSRKT